MAKVSLAVLSPEAIAQVAQWLSDNGDTLPEPVRIALEQHAAFVEALRGSKQQIAAIVVQLHRALGIGPQSERRNSNPPLGATCGGDRRTSKDPYEQLQIRVERLQRLSKWHGSLARRQRRKMKALRSKLEAKSVEEVELSAEEEAENEEATARQMERYALGTDTGVSPDPTLQPVSETLMSGAQVTTSEETTYLSAPVPDGEGATVLETRTEQRVRHDLTLVVGRVVADVEKKVVVDAQGNRRMVSASTAELGPPRFDVTWRFMVNVVVLVVQYAMPMNRLGTLLSTSGKKFTAAAISRMLRYVAEHFLPIYLQLFDDLADAEIFQGDDTSPRVLEVTRYFANPDSSESPPWQSYRNMQRAAQTIDEAEAAEKAAAADRGARKTRRRPQLEAILSRELGFEFPYRAKDGSKQSLNTTVVAGRADQQDPRSAIVFYRSHLGGLGNLLEVLLQKRRPDNSVVMMQSDLATVNLIHDPELRKRFLVKQFGCGAHARRPFALYEHEDADYCGFMLHLFKGLAIHEHGLDLYGRNAENVAAIRDVDSRALWAEIKGVAEDMKEKWSHETKLGRGARYILRHFEELTAYLDDPRLQPTNNYSERMLRMEKLIQAGSMFRATLGGRFVFDIIRTVLQTAIAARVPLQEYVLSILRTSDEDIVASPERFTPRAWACQYGDALTASDANVSAPDANAVPAV